MRIVVVAPGLLPVPAINGGAVEQLIDTFINESERVSNDELVVFSVSDRIKKETYFKKNNTTYIQIPYYKCPAIMKGKLGEKVYYRMKYIRYIRSIKKYLKNNSHDLILIENRPQFVAPLNNVTKKPIYLHLHNEEILQNYRKYKDIPQKVQSILVVSDYIGAKIKKIYHCDNVQVVHNGIKIDQFKKETDAKRKKKIREKYKIGQNGFVVVFTGRFTREKGVLELIRAFSLIEKSNVELVIIGSSWFGANKLTPYINMVEEETKKSKNKIIFTGFLTNVQVAEIESAADIAVIPSIWDDPLPLTVIEAMASALPTIVTDSGGIPEMCTNETSIIIKRDEKLVENIATAIVEFQKNPILCEQYGLSARKRVEEHFSTEQYYDRITKAIGENR